MKILKVLGWIALIVIIFLIIKSLVMYPSALDSANESLKELMGIF